MKKKFQVHKIEDNGEITISEKELSVHPDGLTLYERRVVALEVKEAAFKRVSKRGDTEKALRIKKEIYNLQNKLSA